MIAVTEDGLRVFTDGEEISLGEPLEAPDRHDRDDYQGHDRRDKRDQDKEISPSDFPI